MYKYDTSFTITLQYHNTELLHYTIPQYRAITLRITELLLYALQSYDSTYTILQ